jgi:hypothetical protein
MPTQALPRLGLDKNSGARSGRAPPGRHGNAGDLGLRDLNDIRRIVTAFDTGTPAILQNSGPTLESKASGPRHTIRGPYEVIS